MGISIFDPLNAFQLAEHLGVSVFSVEDIFGDHSLPEYVNMCDTAKFSALWMPNQDGDKIIIHNEHHSKFRQQSNLMHELSHIIREHTVPDNYAVLCAQFGLHYYSPQQEQEAKYLGGCLQITKPGLLWALKHGRSNEWISEYYNASLDMVHYRLGVSGVLTMRCRR